jgi:hypothetical protein
VPDQESVSEVEQNIPGQGFDETIDQKEVQDNRQDRRENAAAPVIKPASHEHRYRNQKGGFENGKGNGI